MINSITMILIFRILPSRFINLKRISHKLRLIIPSNLFIGCLVRNCKVIGILCRLSLIILELSAKKVLKNIIITCRIRMTRWWGRSRKYARIMWKRLRRKTTHIGSKLKKRLTKWIPELHRMNRKWVISEFKLISIRPSGRII